MDFYPAAAKIYIRYIKLFYDVKRANLSWVEMALMLIPHCDLSYFRRTELLTK